MEFKLGDTDIPFVFRGDELIYPNYVKDGLVLHYDFSGMSNADISRGIATDLSGNGNHGKLQNFNYTVESGYDKNKLLFDGVDDSIVQRDLKSPSKEMTISAVISFPHDSVHNSGDIITWYTDILMRVAKNGSITFIDKRMTPDRFIGGFDYDTSKPFEVTLVSKGNKNEIYFNGEMIKDLIGTIDEEKIISAPLMFATYSTTFVGINIFDSKIYNRPLTASEIAHNYAIEKERFGIE